jgi:anti-sigma factor RsiW
MTHCSLLHENVFAYAEKELPPGLMLTLDMHVSECRACASVLEKFESVMSLIEEQKNVEPPPFAETRIMQAIESRLEKQQKSSAPVFVRVLQPAFISVGILAAVSIGFLIGSDFADTQLQYNQNEEITESVRSDLNVPEFMTDDLFYFSE